jgi:hypothetical protein
MPLLFSTMKIFKRNSIFFVVCFLVFKTTIAQELSGIELVKKTIEYHDPNNNWTTFKGAVFIEMKMPNGSNRLSEVRIDLPKEYFKLTNFKSGNKTEHIVDKNNCTFSLNGTTQFTEEEAKTYNLNEARAKSMKNYYTFLYGLPMKLNDPGTIINPKVEKKEFLGKEYLVLKVKYEEGVGTDAWYFYFDPITYAMEIYQFYHDETKNDGEYILLSEQEVYSGIKIPKIRTWFYNKDGSYLATDTLTKVSAL